MPGDGRIDEAGLAGLWDKAPGKPVNRVTLFNRRRCRAVCRFGESDPLGLVGPEIGEQAKPAHFAAGIDGVEVNA